MDIAELLAFSVKNNASDLHISAGLPPMIRVDGDIRRINVPALDHKTVHSLIYDIMNDKQRKDYEEFLETDFSFEIPNLARFRVNAFNHNRGAGGVFRTIPSTILTLEELGCPTIFREVADQPRGIVLVTGPTGSGKTTTLYSALSACWRRAFFESLRDPANRHREPWVLQGLANIHHPLRAPAAIPLVLPALEMLEEIQDRMENLNPEKPMFTFARLHRSSP